MSYILPFILSITLLLLCWLPDIVTSYGPSIFMDGKIPKFGCLLTWSLLLCTNIGGLTYSVFRLFDEQDI